MKSRFLSDKVQQWKFPVEIKKLHGNNWLFFSMFNAVRVMLLFLIVFLSFSLLNIWYTCKCKEPKKDQHTRYFSVFFLTWGICCLADLMISPRMLFVEHCTGCWLCCLFLFQESSFHTVIFSQSLSRWPVLTEQHFSVWVLNCWWLLTHKKFSFWSSVCFFFLTCTLSRLFCCLWQKDIYILINSQHILSSQCCCWGTKVLPCEYVVCFGEEKKKRCPCSAVMYRNPATR